jgi:hypothetical protein
VRITDLNISARAICRSLRLPSYLFRSSPSIQAEKNPTDPRPTPPSPLPSLTELDPDPISMPPSSTRRPRPRPPCPFSTSHALPLLQHRRLPQHAPAALHSATSRRLRYCSCFNTDGSDRVIEGAQIRGRCWGGEIPWLPWRGGADPVATLPGRRVREHPRPGRRPSIGVDDDEGSTRVEDRDCGALGDSSGGANHAGVLFCALFFFPWAWWGMKRYFYCMVANC